MNINLKDKKKRLYLINEYNKKKKKIATILPYKENYTFGKASAASLWVAEFFLNLNIKKIIIFMDILNIKII